MPQRMEIRRGFGTVLMAFVISACGGGGGGGGSTGSAPTIANLQYAPESALQYDGEGTTAVNGSFSFTDPDGDLASVTLTTSQGSTLTMPISGASGITSGTVSASVEVDTSVVGHYTFSCYVTDRQGNRSNSLSGSFEVLQNDAANRWTERSLPVPTGSAVKLYDVVRAPAQYVAVGEGIFTSPDGVTWTERATGVDHALRDVTWTGSRFVAVGDGGTVLTSPDGVDWALQPVPVLIEPMLQGVTASPSRYVAVGTRTDEVTFSPRELILTSPDGVQWSVATQDYDMVLADVTWSGTQFVAAGAHMGGASSEAAVLVSTDGLNWTRHVVDGPTFLRRIVWSGSAYVATGYGGAVRSIDGQAWTVVGQGTVTGGAISWSGQRFLTCGTYYCQSSVDGEQWATTVGQLPGTGATVNGLAWGGTQWVAVGQAVNAPLVLTSP